MILSLPFAASLLVPAVSQEAQESPDFIVLHMEDARTLLAHPKDAALLKALEMIDDRAAELPSELNGAPPIDPATVELLGQILVGSKTLRVGLRPEANLDMGEIPFVARLDLHRSNADDAQALAERIGATLAGMGMPRQERGEDGLEPIPGIPLPTRFGPRGNDVVLDMGAPDRPAPDFSREGLPNGVKASFGMALDYGALLSFGEKLAMAGGDPEAAQIFDILRRFGLDELELRAAWGADSDRSYGVVRIPGHAARMQELGLLPESTLSPEDINLVPRDAVWAAVGKVNLEGTFELILDVVEDMMAEQGAEGDPVEMLAGLTGFHLRNDLIDVLGDTFGVYASDSTGGGGLMSTVLFMSLQDADGMIDTKERLEELVNGLAQMELEGYVQVRQWSQNDVELSTLVFPGLPVPLEPTVAVTPTHIFIGASPQAALAAVGQSRSGNEGLLDNAALREQLAGGISGIYSLSFQDTARLARDGYGMTSMLMAALSNGVRSRFDVMREPGPILPSFHELATGAKATVAVARAIEGDWVQESRGDASVLVGLSAMSGWMSSNGLALAAPMMAVGWVTAREQEAMMLEAMPSSDF